MCNIAEYNNLGKEVKYYDPKIALLGGKDGFSSYKKLAFIFNKICHSKSFCFVEIGYNQSRDSVKIFRESGIDCVEIIKDYQNFERIIVLKKK